MQPQPLSPIRKAWYKWKSLHLPWRKRFLIGLDLQQNTYWEFRDTLSSHQHRMRRIVQYPSSTPLSDVSISPQWHQWLRHTRAEAPSLSEQMGDVARQERLKVLVGEADRRWEGKGRLGGVDVARGEEGLLASRDAVVNSERGPLVDASFSAPVTGGQSESRAPVPVVGNGNREAEEEKHTFNERSDGRKVKEKKQKEDPWKQARGAPSEDWQPQAWSPSATAAKR